MDNQVVAAIDAFGVVVTATDRLARDLHIRYGLARRSIGGELWERPNIQSLRQWTTTSWERSWPTTQLLHPVQETVLYRSAIAASPAASAVLNVGVLARAARASSAALRAYRIDRSGEEFRSSEEAQAFVSWVEAVDVSLSEHGWTTSAGMMDELISFIRSGQVTLPARALFLGFVHFTPQEAELLDAMTLAGCIIESRPRLFDHNVTVSLCRPALLRSELRFAAQWAEELLRPFVSDPSSAPRVGILVPDLGRYRDGLESMLTDVIAPHNNAAIQGEHISPWRYGQGQPLSEHEVVAAAMNVIAMRRYDNDCQTVSRFLLNRRFGNGPEYYARAAIDISLREQAGRRIGLEEVIYRARKAGRTYCEVFAKRLEGLLEHLSDHHGRVLPSEWVERFRCRLKCMGWPGGALSSSAFQAIRALEECLALFSSMDRQIGSIGQGAAEAYLSEIISSREHQPRVRYQQPISILSYEDAIGMHFDHALVLGASSDAVPPPADPYQFIPLSTQRLVGIPMSGPDAALEYGRHLYEQLQHVADNVVFSCPLRNDAGVRLHPSPLICGWPEAEMVMAPPADHRATVLAAGVKSEMPTVDAVPVVIDAASEGISGGTRIVADFAQMPFIAFARHRLHAKAFPLHASGLTSQVQGVVVHDVLRRVWGVIGNSDALNVLSDDGLSGIIHNAVQAAFAANRSLLPWKHGERLVDIERARVAGLIREWMNFERTREHAFEIVATEHEATAVIGALSIPVRIDRIDRITDSAGGMRYVVVDYKTGAKVDVSGWNADQLTEPQLPIYASCIDLSKLGIDRVDGIAFAHVTSPHCAMPVRTNWTAALVPTKNTTGQFVVENWDGQQAAWRSALAAMVSAFLGGKADADIITLPHSFLHGDLGTFTRHGKVT